MKKTILMLSMASFLFWAGTSCDDGTKEPLVKDATPPGPVSNPKAKSIPGGAQITYDIPTDEDALYVEGSYKRNGKKVVARSSVYADTLLIQGLNSTEPQEVELVVVDRSENRSKPVKVPIKPEESPLKQIFKSFKMLPDFGGPRLNYKNPNQIKVEILLHTIEEGKKTYKQSAFLEKNTGTEGFYTFRDSTFHKKPFMFALEATDRWGNTTGSFKNENGIQSFREDLLDRRKMKVAELKGDYTKEPWGAYGWQWRNLFDGSKSSGYAGGDVSTLTDENIVPPYTEKRFIVTIDLGVNAKLSRFKFFHRLGSFLYTHYNPRYFDIWATNKIPADDGASLEAGWVQLIKKGEAAKPSGSPSGTNTAADIAAAEAGFEFLIPIDAPDVRYFRFVMLESWQKGNGFQFMEFEFYGQAKEE